MLDRHIDACVIQSKLTTIKEDIQLDIDKYEEKINKLKNKIESLESRIWKYKVGDIVLDKTYLRLWEVVELIDKDKNYLYKCKPYQSYNKNNHNTFLTLGLTYFNNDDLLDDRSEREKYMQEYIFDLVEKLKSLGISPKFQR